MQTKRKKISSDAKHAKIHGKDLVETEKEYLRLNQEHKDWYNRSEMGKQRGKPRYAPPKVKKAKKIWKKK